MNLLNPSSLLLLLPLAAAIIALYLLRMRRKDLRVPASFLWPERTDEIRANSLFQKLKFSWLLVLQLLALALLGFAFAQPQMKQKGLAGSVTCVVLDASASMNTKEGTRTRFEMGLDQVKQMISSASAGDRLALIVAGSQPSVIFPLSSDPAKQKLALAKAKPTDADADVGEALRLAAALVGTTEKAQIVVLSDGVFSPVENFSPGKAGVRFSVIGKETENLGIQALGSTATDKGLLLYCGVNNYGAKAKQASLNLYADGKLIDSVKVDAVPGKVWNKTVLAPPGVKVFEARLKSGDAFPTDDYAVSLTSAGSSLRVLLVGKGDMFIEKALALEARVTLERSDKVPNAEKKSSPGPGVYDIVIFDGAPVEPVKARGVLVFGSPNGLSYVQGQGTAKNPKPGETEAHPLTKGVDFSEVYIDSAAKVQETAGGKALVSSSAGPLVVAHDGPTREVFVAFEPLNSDFPLTIGFPIFLSNALDWLGGRAAGSEISISPGQSFAIPTTAQEVKVEGENLSLTVPAKDQRAVVKGVDRVGEYKLTGGGSKKLFVSLRSDHESDITPNSKLNLGTKSVAGQSSVDRLADIWKPLLVLALLVLAGEWWFFARRS